MAAAALMPLRWRKGVRDGVHDAPPLHVKVTLMPVSVGVGLQMWR